MCSNTFDAVMPLVGICAGVPGARHPYRDHWTLRGAHLLLQTRTKVLNEELDGLFRRWYPKFRLQSPTQETERKAP